MADMISAGADKTTIAPPVGVDLTGFGGRSGPSAGVHDDLRAGALYVCDGTTPALIITADLIGLDASEVAEIRGMIAQATDIPPTHVMISCSHTHSGPATACLDYLGKVDEEYLSVLKRQLAGVAKTARDKARRAIFGYAREPVSVGINRREALPGGGVVLGRNETGLTAPYVDVWTLDDAVTSAPIARLFCHAAHAVTLGSDNLLISADWPGYAQRTIECMFPGAPALFAQGCCGNINSDPRGTFAIARLQGQVMAGAVAKAAGRAAKSGVARVGVAAETIQLPLQAPPSITEARSRLDALIARRDLNATDANYGTRMMDDGIVEWGRRLVALSEEGRTQRTIDYEIQAICIGDAVWVGLPGEVFVEYALHIAKSSPFAQTTVAAYTNGNPGYVPTALAFSQGGYEVEHAIQFYGDTMMVPQSEELIRAAAVRVLAALR